MKQTAVEWLFDNLNITGGSDDMKTFDQAKAMEKEQIIEAYWDGGQDVPMHVSTLENYYNKTFKSK